jgi:hypothetical protein
MKRHRILRLMMLSCAWSASSSGVAQSSVDEQRTDIARNAAEQSTSKTATDAIPSDPSFLCKFTSGPQTGRIVDLAGRSGAAAIPVGGRCSDGTSSGISVIGTSGDKESLTWNGAITGRTTNRRTSTICQFMSGPKAHGWHDFAPFPPAPVDSICDDGAGSVGFVQPAGHGDRY